MACRLALPDVIPQPRGGTPLARAHWYRDLYKVIRNQASPATTRAAVRWCFARLEHEAIRASSRTRDARDTAVGAMSFLRWPRGERFGRWLYRFVGYGQRPSRAFWTWLTMTVAMAIWSLWTVPADGGAGHYFLRGVALLVAPLRILRLGSEAASPLALIVHENGRLWGWFAFLLEKSLWAGCWVLVGCLGGVLGSQWECCISEVKW